MSLEGRILRRLRGKYTGENSCCMNFDIKWTLSYKTAAVRKGIIRKHTKKIYVGILFICKNNL